MVTGLLAVTGCSHGKASAPPVQVRTPRIATSRITLPDAEATGLAQFGRWPKACALLTDRDLTALLPQVTKVETTSRKQRVRVLGAGGDSDGDGDAYDVPNSSCEVRFWVGGAERRPHARPDVVRVEDIAVGNASVVGRNYRALARGKPVTPEDLGAAECVRDVVTYYCLLPRIAFAVGAASTVSVDRFTGQPPGVRTYTYWVGRVLPLLVRSVASKLPRGQ